MQEPVEAPEELPAREAGGGRGKEAGEEPQKIILQPIPINMDPSATAQPKNSPLTVHILPSPTAQFTPKHLLPKPRPSHLHYLCNISRSEWPLFKHLPLHRRHWQLLILHGIMDGSSAGSDMEHLDLSIPTNSTSSSSLQRVEKLVWGEHSLPYFLF